MSVLLLPLLIACSGRPAVDAPPDMVPIVDADPAGPGTYWIDRYEFPNRLGAKPTVYVDLDTAQQRCADSGKRLCTAAEWRRACQGPEGLRYGYGAQHQRGRCHTEERLASGHTSMMDPTGLIAESGRFPDCTTAEGAVDMVGNAEEWVLDDWHGLAGMLEGGAWYTWSGYADCSGAYSRQPDYRLDPDRAVFSAGFRCCWSQAAPTRAELSQAAIAADSQARLAEAASRAGEVAYDPAPEVELSPGLHMDVFEYPNRAGEYARTVVSWTEASGLCQDAGKRLCSAYEWEQACASPAGNPYPYGGRYVESACPISLDHAPRAGQAFACISPAGAQDLVGGVWEWTSSELTARALGTAAGETLRELRGGSWLVDRVKGVCEPYDGYPVASQSAAFPDVGFRCCRGEEEVSAIQAQHGTLRCPEGMASLPGERGDFCIDRYELPGEAGKEPLINLSLQDAREQCSERGKHVCTEDEWLAACAGPRRRRWPYGNEYQAERCNDAAAQAPGEGGQAMPSGRKADCVSPEGVYDLSGNLWEWTIGADGRGLLHGGGWNISAGLNQCRAIAQADDEHRIPEFGARCCATADEAAELR